MTCEATELVKINLTPDQRDTIKQQTGLDRVPELIHLTISELVAKMATV